MSEYSDQSFRDSIATVNADGERVWIHPKKPKGKFHNYRTIVAWALLIFMFSAPLINLNGEQLILLDVINRKFVLFGLTFWPQDFFIFVLMFLAGVVFIVLFTVVYGRIFCGWICPQTIFMEMVFRKIEYLFEGDYTKQKRLDTMSFRHPEKLLRRGGKHLVFLLLSFIISNVFLAYLISTEELLKIINEPINEHFTGFIVIWVFTGAFYWVFAWFREQVCIIACPYGRLQGVMLDQDSMVVAYNYERGEPRGKLRKNQERTEGDCIDCLQCVHVCPTGIDIRHGTQLECINCTACIDACDDIMDIIHKPRGLIGFYSENNIKNHRKFHFTPRIMAYSAILVVLLGIVSTLVLLRTDVDVTILKAQGQLYSRTEQNEIENVFKINIINKTNKQIPVELSLEGIKGTIKVVGKDIVVPEGGLVNEIVIVRIPQKELEKLSTDIKINVFSEGKLICTEKTKFLSPAVK